MSQVFDSLVCVLSTFLGCNFTCLWIDLALAGNPRYSEKTKNLYLLIVILILAIVTSLDLGLHIYFTLFAKFSKSDKIFLVLLINNTNKLTVSLLLLLNSIMACSFVKLVYSRKAARTLSRNISLVTVILVTSYELKAVFPIFISNLSAQNYT
jgi:hypothetical protein